MRTNLYAIASLAAAVILLASCSSEKTVGTPAPGNTPPVALATVLSQPGEYHDKTVVLEGILTGQCGSLCDFTYTEKGKSVTIFMGKDKPPRLKSGTPVRVTAKVHSGEQQVVLTATGLTYYPGRGGK
jgi:hypothetical protein